MMRVVVGVIQFQNLIDDVSLLREKLELPSTIISEKFLKVYTHLLDSILFYFCQISYMSIIFNDFCSKNKNHILYL